METPRPWQKEVIDKLFHGDHHIVWVVAPAMTGKTWFADYLAKNHGAKKIHEISMADVVTFKVDNHPTIVFDIDRVEHIDPPAFMKLGDASAFITDSVCCLPRVLCLATFEPPEVLDEMECLTMIVR